MEKHAGALSWSPVKVAYAELKFLLSRLVLVAGLVLLKGRLRIYRLSKAARSAHPRPSIWKPGDRDDDSRKDRGLLRGLQRKLRERRTGVRDASAEASRLGCRAVSAAGVDRPGSARSLDRRTGIRRLPR